MSATYHCSLDVDGGLRMSDAMLGALLREKETGRTLTASEARAYLVCAKAAGHAVVPVGTCDRHDFQKGCLGHAQE